MNKDNPTPRYKIIRKLGSGAFGTVYECLDKTENKKVAVKRIHKAGTVLSREYEVLLELQHTHNCINMLDCFFIKTENVFHQHLVLEFIESDLQAFINLAKMSPRPFRLNVLKSLGFQIFKGLAEMEERHIMHRDLKPENILRTKHNIVKIADFGNSKFYVPKKHNSPYNVTQFYRAPELFLAYCDYNNKIDVWAAGCILAELIWLEPFFHGNSDSDQFFAIIRTLGSPSNKDIDFYYLNSPIDKKYLNIPKIEPDLTKIEKLYQGFGNKSLAKDFFEKIFQLNPLNRSPASELINDPFFDEVRFFCEKDFQEFQ